MPAEAWNRIIMIESTKRYSLQATTTLALKKALAASKSSDCSLLWQYDRGRRSSSLSRRGFDTRGYARFGRQSSNCAILLLENNKKDLEESVEWAIGVRTRRRYHLIFSNERQGRDHKTNQIFNFFLFQQRMRADAYRRRGFDPTVSSRSCHP
jgi:hypothetical protein